MGSTLPRTLALAGALAVLGGAGSCAGDPTDLGPEDVILVAFDGPVHSWSRDDWDFLDATRVGDHLEMEIAYGGGCTTHELRLLAVRGFSTFWDAASPLPTVTVPLFLAHEAHDDPCDAYVTAALRFDLRPLRAAFQRQVHDGPGRIVLRIPEGQGSADSVSVDYIFD